MAKRPVLRLLFRLVERLIAISLKRARTNLASDADHQTVLAEMRQRLDRWIEESDDRGRTPEPARMYDSDMAEYLGGAGKKGRNTEIEKNIALMKDWAAAGK